MKRLLFLFALVCAPARAQDFVQSYNFINTGTHTVTANFANTGITSFFISWSSQVTLASCAVQVDSSSDGVTWGSGDLIASQNCSLAGSSGAAQSLASGKNFLRINVTALIGNGGLNVTLKGWGGAGGGGANPSGNTGDVQTRNGSNLAAGHINDNGTVMNFSEDAQMCGANPAGIDVRCFGVRFVSPTTAPATTGITATCTATNTSLPISSASSFHNGDGIVVFGCGASSGMSTPSAPTVTTSLAGAPPGTGVVVTAPSNGSTVTCYVYADRDKGQGLTVASGETCATGQPLGQKTLSITSSSISNNTLTYTTAARSPELLAVGMYFCIAGTTVDGIYGGCMTIASIPGNTSFTVTSNQDTRNGTSSAGATGGTMTYWRMNHVVPPSPGTNVWQHIYYAGATGAETFDGIGQVVNSNLSADSSYQVWDDLGSPYTTPPTRPLFVPNSPPSSAVADSLVTTIASGAGTATLTLTTAPTTTPSGSEPILLEFGQNMASAFAAAQTAQTQVYIPQSSAGQLVVNAFTDLSSYYNTGISVAGGLYLNDTLSIRGDWMGEYVRGNLSTPQFSYSGYTVININAANPGVLLTAGGLVQGFAFQVTGTQNQYNSVYLSGGNIPSLRMENCAFTGSSASDYNGVNFSAFGKGVAGSNPAGLIFRNILTNSNQGNSATSQWMIKNFGEVNFDGVAGSGRGFYIGQLGSGTHVDYNGRIEIQSLSTPFFAAYAPGSAIIFNLTNIVEDTGAMPIIAALTSNTIGATFNNVSYPSSSIPIVSGYPLLTLAGAPNGVNSQGISYGRMTDGIYNASSQAAQVENNHLIMGTGYSLFASPGVPAAPTCVVNSAGPPYTPAGSHTFSYVAYYPNNGQGTPSPVSNTCVANGTSQQIVITGTAPLGATSYQWFSDGTNLPTLNAGGCSGVTYPNTISWTWTGSVCSFVSQPTVAGGGPAGMQNGTIWAQEYLGLSIASINLTAQTSSISSTTLYAVPSGAGGLFAVYADVITTTAGTGGTVVVTVSWNNGTTSPNLFSTPFALNAQGEQPALLGTFYCAASQNITYSTTVTNSSGSPQYSLRIRLVYLG